ncbi:MAG: right-handed parallel beta-helix repeat-containing protein [Acidimicrobiales bacterium]|nr:right-handed parallel beta-helix repeat-containing protein [Acidimicrobiales bacterium]
MGQTPLPRFITNTLRALRSRVPLRAVLIALSLLLAFLSVSPVSAATPVSGTIAEDTTWTLANSPITVTGNVMVEPGVTLTIEPGVTVKFDSGLGLAIKGTLIARGTATSTITFTSSAASPAAGDWVNILFHPDSQDATFDGNGDYSSGSILEHCVVEYGANRMVCANSSAPFINYCTIHYSSLTGILASNVKILNSTITQNGGTGIVGGELTLINSTISNNGWGGEAMGSKVEGTQQSRTAPSRATSVSVCCLAALQM